MIILHYCSLITKDLKKGGYGDRDLNLTFTHKIDSLISQYNPKFRMLSLLYKYPFS